MNRAWLTLKIIGMGLLMSAFILIFWPFVIPGLLLGLAFRGKVPQWLNYSLSLAIVIFTRLSDGGSLLAPLGQPSHPWFVELVLAAFSWAIGSLLMTAGSRIPWFFMKGLKSGEVPRS